MDPASLFDLIIAIIALPFQIIHQLVFAIGDLLVFDILGLGPFLPIQL